MDSSHPEPNQQQLTEDLDELPLEAAADDLGTRDSEKGRHLLVEGVDELLPRHGVGLETP